MKMKQSTIVLAANLMLPALASAGQDCGLPEKLISTQYSNASSWVQQTIISMLSRSTHQQSMASLGTGFSIPGFQVNANADNHRAFQEALRHDSFTDTILSKSSETLKTSGDPVLLDAFRACLGDQSPILVSVEQRDQVAKLKVEFRTHRMSRDRARVRKMTNLTKQYGVQVTFDTCKELKSLKAGDSCSIDFKMPNDKGREVIFTIKTSMGEGSAYIPPRRKFVFDPQSGPIPSEYFVGGGRIPASVVELTVTGGTPLDVHACTAPLEKGKYILVTKDHPKIIATPHKDFQHGDMVVTEPRITTAPGLHQAVCFSFVGQWRGGGRPDEKRRFVGYLQGSVVDAGWK